MADAITPLDLTGSSYDGENQTDATFATITSGTGVDFNFADADFIVLKNTSVASRTFTVTVPIPEDSPLAETNSNPPDKVYTVAAGKTWVAAVANSFRDANHKVTVDCSGTGCSIRAYKVRG